MPPTGDPTDCPAPRAERFGGLLIRNAFDPN
jgi:hypothetical protein